MALASYYIILDQESLGGKMLPATPWNGAAAGSEVTALKSARLLTVTAESAAEAIRGVKSQYGGWVKGPVLGVATASVEEG